MAPCKRLQQPSYLALNCHCGLSVQHCLSQQPCGRDWTRLAVAFALSTCLLLQSALLLRAPSFLAVEWKGRGEAPRQGVPAGKQKPYPRPVQGRHLFACKPVMFKANNAIDHLNSYFCLRCLQMQCLGPRKHGKCACNWPAHAPLSVFTTSATQFNTACALPQVTAGL